jgi:hypothetical protein
MFFQHDGFSLPNFIHTDCSRLEGRRNIWWGRGSGYYNPSSFAITSEIPFMKTPVEPEENLLARILSACETVQYTASLSGCARTWRVSAMPAVKSVAATSKSLCKLIKNNILKIIHKI